MATQRNYRKFTAQQKLEIVLAGLRSDRSIRDVCREHEMLLESGKLALAGKDERQAEKELRKKIGELDPLLLLARQAERALGRKTYELEIAGEALRGWE